MNATLSCLVCFLPFLAACSGSDDSQLSDRYVYDGTEPGATPDPSSGDAGGADAAANADSAPPDAPPPGPNAFTGAAAFVSKLGPTTRKTAHNFPGNNPTTSPMGQACATAGCHTGFVMGGTVYADVAGTMPAAGVEVRARDAAGNAVSAWTDQDGNFYVPPAAAGAFKMPALVGVRSASASAAMVATIANGTCASSSCHVAGKQGRVHLP